MFPPGQTLCVRPVRKSKLEWVRAVLAAETHLEMVEVVDDLEPGSNIGQEETGPSGYRNKEREQERGPGSRLSLRMHVVECASQRVAK